MLCVRNACGRRQKLEGALRSKQKALDTARRKPDPMAKEPELRRNIERLSAKAHGKVGTGFASALASAC